MTDLNSRDAQLVRFLNEAYAKEAELEADLTAHIALTQKQRGSAWRACQT